MTTTSEISEGCIVSDGDYSRRLRVDWIVNGEALVYPVSESERVEPNEILPVDELEIVGRP